MSRIELKRSAGDPSKASAPDRGFREGDLGGLKTRAIRGGVAKTLAQGANVLLRMGSLMILARLLEPEDFGLVGMVTAITGVLSLFKEFGLSSATVQQATVTEEQISTLFWVNVAVGLVLSVTSVVMAPFVASFYREPRLVLIMVALAAAFLFNASGVQHSALLQRQMRFTALAVADVVSLLVSSALSIGMALAGFGYWALVVWSVSLPLTATVVLWLQARWVPGRPRRNSGVRSMMRFGGTLTINSLVCYVAYNLDKVLLGRFWGAEAIGVYGRAYQLITLPTDNLNAAVGGVGFPVLARLQHDPQRLRRFFLNSYSLMVGVTVPIAAMCAVYPYELIFVTLGTKWLDAVPLFQTLAPMVLIFALINPPGWFLLALGRVDRSLAIALVIAPLVVSGYVLGLPYGPRGVALGYSAAMTLWVVPHLVWCFRGTVVSFADVLRVIAPPLAAGVVSASLSLGLVYFGPLAQASAFVRLLAGGLVLAASYTLILWFPMRQKSLYFDLYRGFRVSPDATSAVQPSA